MVLNAAADDCLDKELQRSGRKHKEMRRTFFHRRAKRMKRGRESSVHVGCSKTFPRIQVGTQGISFKT